MPMLLLHGEIVSMREEILEECIYTASVFKLLDCCLWMKSNSFLAILFTWVKNCTSFGL